jgi:hypothetical protein
VINYAEAYYQMTFSEFAAHAQRAAKRAGFDLESSTAIYEGSPLFARIHRGKWVVICPDCLTEHTELLWTTKLFVCQRCWNSVANGKWRRIWFPKDWQEIERVLSLRPLAHTRNWRPFETLQDLIDENEANGL